MMQQKLIAASICLTLLLSATAWSAPKAAHPQIKGHATSPDKIVVTSDDGGHGGGYGGKSETWTLRANDTATHSKTYSPSEKIQGAKDVTDAVGVMEPGAFNRMRGYLQWTHSLNLKVPHTNEASGLTVSLVSNGKSKSVRIMDGVSPVDAAMWTTLTLVDSLTNNVKWKTRAQFKAVTGLAVLYQIDDTLSKTEIEAAKLFPRPLFSVLNAAGQEVALLKPNTDQERTAFLKLTPIYSDTWVKDQMISSFFTLAPGNYHLAFKKLEGVAPTQTNKFAWRVIGEETESKIPSATVTPGRFSFIVIRLDKQPAPPGEATLTPPK